MTYLALSRPVTQRTVDQRWLGSAVADPAPPFRFQQLLLFHFRVAGKSTVREYQRVGVAAHLKASAWLKAKQGQDRTPPTKPFQI